MRIRAGYVRRRLSDVISRGPDATGVQALRCEEVAAAVAKDAAGTAGYNLRTSQAWLVTLADNDERPLSSLSEQRDIGDTVPRDRRRLPR